MSRTDPKKVVFTGMASVAKALSHPHRIEILELLAQGEQNVETVAERAGLSVANASQHLRLMRSAGLLVSRRDGKNVVYAIGDGTAIGAIGALGRVAERNRAEVREVVSDYFNARDCMEPVSRAELLKRVKDGTVTLVDVRPAEEYGAGHVPGALNIPFRQLAERLGELPSGVEVVAYCRGPYCVLAFEAVALLRRLGIDARRLEDGYPEWKAAGLPVDTAETRRRAAEPPPA